MPTCIFIYLFLWGLKLGTAQGSGVLEIKLDPHTCLCNKKEAHFVSWIRGDLVSGISDAFHML